MNEPTPAAPLESTLTINEIENLARRLMPVPTGFLIVTQSLSVSPDSQSITWTVSHFPPDVYNKCTIGQDATAQQAIQNLIKQLTPCA